MQTLILYNKTIELNKYVSGLVASTYDVMMASKTQGYLPTITRYIKLTLPCLAAGATFATVACVSTNLRGKDDKINYFLGGGAAGAIFGIAGKYLFL